MMVLLLHDVCDPFLEISKIAICLSEDRSGKVDKRLLLVSDIATPILLLTWIFNRLYVFPLRCIWAASQSLRSCDFVYAYWVTMVLTVLCFLNVMWAAMIVRALVHRLSFGLFTDETVEDPDPVALLERRSTVTSHQKET